MRSFWISWNGQSIEAGSIVEKSRDIIEKMGVNLDELGEYEALLLAANVQNKTVPELLGIN